MTDITWTGDRWPSSHAIMETFPQEAVEIGKALVHTYCGLRGIVDTRSSTDRLGSRKSCETCARVVLRQVTT